MNVLEKNVLWRLFSERAKNIDEAKVQLIILIGGIMMKVTTIMFLILFPITLGLFIALGIGETKYLKKYGEPLPGVLVIFGMLILFPLIGITSYFGFILFMETFCD